MTMTKLEETMITHARQAVLEMKSYSMSGEGDDFIRAFNESGALIQLGKVADSGLSEQAMRELEAVEQEQIALFRTWDTGRVIAANGNVKSKKVGGAHINMPDPLAESERMKRMISDTAALCQEAVPILVGQGLTQQDAEHLVEELIFKALKFLDEHRKDGI